jgi:hypothetical protein
MATFDPLEALSHIDTPKGRTARRSDSLWIGMFLKPMIMLLAALAFGYATTWLSTNFVKQDQFSRYVEKQIDGDKKQDQDARERFEITQTKLQTIINQQITYAEQAKLFNEVIQTIRKDVENIEERVKYLERKQQSLHPQ